MMDSPLYNLTTLTEVAEQLSEEQMDRWYADFKIWARLCRSQKALNALGVEFVSKRMCWIDDSQVGVGKLSIMFKTVQQSKDEV